MSKSVIIAVLALLALAVPAQAQWVTPADYKYEPLAECPQPAVRYRPCEDQMAILAKALDDARAKGRKLLIVFGADWCPWCRLIESNLPKPDYLGHDAVAGIDVVNIAMSVRIDKKKIPVPSGKAAQAFLTRAAMGPKSTGGIPFYTLIDPAKAGAVTMENGQFADVVDDKAVNDPARFRTAVRDALDFLSSGAPPPVKSN